MKLSCKSADLADVSCPVVDVANASFADCEGKVDLKRPTYYIEVIIMTHEDNRKIIVNFSTSCQTHL